MTLRLATLDDAAFFRRLRNDATTVRMSRHAEPVGEAEHAAWLAHVLINPAETGVVLFVAEIATGLVGTGRLTFCQDSSEITPVEISLVVAPESRGAGYGRALIEALVAEASRRGVRRVWAEVKPDNLASLRAFLGAGFTGGLVRLERAL